MCDAVVDGFALFVLSLAIHVIVWRVRRPESFRATPTAAIYRSPSIRLCCSGSGPVPETPPEAGVERARDNRWQRPAEVPLDRNGPTDVPFASLPADFTERPLFEWFEARARRDPAATALVDRTDRLSYEAVQSRSLALAQHIQVTVPRGGAVAIWLRI